MFIARKGDTTTLGPKGRQTYEPSGPLGRSILRTFFHNLFLQPFYTTRGGAAPLCALWAHPLNPGAAERPHK